MDLWNNLRNGTLRMDLCHVVPDLPVLRMITIAVDPGKSGGVAFHNKEDGIYNAYNLYPITHMLEDIAMLKHEGFKLQMVVEDIPPFTGNKIPGSSAFKMGVSYGLIQGICLGEQIPCFKITPRDWQKSLSGVKGLKGTERKKVLQDICKRLHPNLNPTLKTCDAILIMHQFINNNTNPK